MEVTMDPKSLPMLDELTELSSADLLYVCRGVGGSDRDRKVLLETLRQFCTSQGVRVIEVLAFDAVSGVVTVDITGTTNVVVFLRGNGSGEVKVKVTGAIPEGCSLQIIAQYPGTFTYELPTPNIGQTVEPLWDGDWVYATLASGIWAHTVIRGVAHQERVVTNAVDAERQRAQQAEGILSVKIDTLFAERPWTVRQFDVPEFVQSGTHVEHLTGFDPDATYEVTGFVNFGRLPTDLDSGPEMPKAVIIALLNQSSPFAYFGTGPIRPAPSISETGNFLFRTLPQPVMQFTGLSVLNYHIAVQSGDNYSGGSYTHLQGEIKWRKVAG